MSDAMMIPVEALRLMIGSMRGRVTELHYDAAGELASIVVKPSELGWSIRLNMDIAHAPDTDA